MQQLFISKDLKKKTVGMSSTVGGSVRDSGGNVRNSEEIEYALRNLRLEIFIHISA